MYYAGIGSRQTPSGVLAIMERVAEWLDAKNYVLRSGGARGADQAFMRGARTRCELYLPWPKYETEAVEDAPWGFVLPEPSKEAMDLAERYHPAWSNCSQGARKLHARNMHILLGPQLLSPVSFIVCWTQGGRIQGGTGQAVRAAEDYQVPVINLGLGLDPAREKLREVLGCAK